MKRKDRTHPMDPKPCARNPFCASLPKETLGKLCPWCVQTDVLAAHVNAHPYRSPSLLVEGALAAFTDGRLQTIVIPGQLMLVPDLAHDARHPLGLSVAESVSFTNSQTHEYLLPSTLASFPNAVVDELLETDLPFVKGILRTFKEQSAMTSYLSVLLYQRDAAEAVRYTLVLLRELGIAGLTHGQVARIAGRNRVTVTRILGELTVSDPELVKVLG